MDKAELIEQLADVEHARWAKWMHYLFSKCDPSPKGYPDGSMLIPPELVERWQRQIETPYASLSETEKESDRHQVARALPIIEKYAGKTSLDDQIKALAQQAANHMWGHPGGPNGMYGSLTITRLEQTGTDEWTAYYNEPDTLTEESVDVARRGGVLCAVNGDNEKFEVPIK